MLCYVLEKTHDTNKFFLKNSNYR